MLLILATFKFGISSSKTGVLSKKFGVVLLGIYLLIYLISLIGKGAYLLADPRESWHIITSKFPPQRGGIGFHSAHIAKGLEKKGYDVIFGPQLGDREKKTRMLQKTV